MQRLVLAASAVLSLVALGVALTARPEAVPPPPAPSGPSVDPQVVASLEGRVRALEAELEVLRSQVRSGGAAAPGVVAGPVAPEALAAQVAQLRQELSDLQAGEALAAPSGREYLKGLVKDAEEDLNRERMQARSETFAKAQEDAKSARTERWKRFASEAGLTWQQEQALNQRLAAEEAKRDELVGKLRDGALGMGEVRRGLSDERRATDEAMAQTLSADQKAKYDAVRAEDRGVGRGGQGPGGGRQPGRGGSGRAS